jgi:outer membrane protein OmpA-like peptidoglycan-associated protein
MQGPRTGLSAGAAVGDELPYAGGGRRSGGGRGAAIGLVALLVAVLAGGLGFALTRGGGESEATASEQTSAPTASAPDTKAPATTAPATSTPKANPTTSTARTATTATPKAAPTTTAPASTVPVADLPPHRAIYRGGKLYLQGTVPSKAVGDKFKEKAAAVLGPDNVIDEYTYDPRVPTPTDGTVEIGEQILFSKGSSTIPENMHATLDLVVAAMQLFPQARAVFEGYTDTSGSLAVNEELSQARAQAMVDYLVSKGVDPSRLEAIGRGPANPIAPNDTEENRARNRRIEFRLIGLLT